jgi:serine/threonine protein kinase
MATPIESAGIALAVTSLSFEIFAGCVKGFQLLSGAHHFGKDAEYLVCMLKLEEYRLILWAKKSGLIDDKLDERLEKELINETLGQLRILLLDTVTLKKRYKLDVRDTDAEQKPSSQLSEALRFLDDETLIKEEEKILGRARLEQKRIHFPKRLWWAAVDHGGFEELNGKVGSLIQRLFDFLSITAQEDVQQQFHLLNLAMLNVVQKLDDLQVVSHLVQRSVVPDETLTTVAELRALQIGESDTTPQTKIPHVKKSLLKDEQKVENGYIAKYEAVPVYVERKKYSESDVAGANAVAISRRVQSLTALLNVPKAPSFRSLHCIGSFQDPEKSDYGFVFDRPLASREHVPPRSLLSLLRSTYIPSQTARFQLAYELATTVLHLHSAGWLHKGLRSENILFFPTSDNAPFTLNEPYVMGFEYARRDAPDEESEKPSLNPLQDIYRHPHAQGPASDRYIKAFDIYALGVILVEIARWRPFADIVEKMGYKLRNVNVAVATDIQKTITGEKNKDKFPVNLRFTMGDEYTKVVLCCLGSYFEDEKLSGKEYIEGFYHMIVQRLKACKV